MNILFDHQTFSIQTFGGVSRYNAELISGINRRDDAKADLAILVSNNVNLKELNFDIPQLLPSVKFPKKVSIVYRINKIYSMMKLRRRCYDVFHPTYYDSYFLPYLKGIPFVITIHDMIHERFAKQFIGLSNNNSALEQKQLLAAHANKIIAVSESTKRDIVDILNIEPSKIQVVYSSSSFNSTTTAETDNRLIKEPYLLFVGRRERYKNFDGLLLAIYPLLKKYRLKLICAGGDTFTSDEKRLICSIGVDELVEQHPITDQILATLYRQAVAFIFPTLYEGFGIPILEAFACDCPCIVANNSSLPEVAGDAALYMDPASQESVIHAVEQMMHDSTLRELLIIRGRERLTYFSWKRTVSETLTVYKSLV